MKNNGMRILVYLLRFEGKIIQRKAHHSTHIIFFNRTQHMNYMCTKHSDNSINVAEQFQSTCTVSTGWEVPGSTYVCTQSSSSTAEIDGQRLLHVSLTSFIVARSVLDMRRNSLPYINFLLSILFFILNFVVQCL